MRLIALACLGLAFALGGTQLYAAQPETAAAQHAIDFIYTLQNDDGGFRDAAAVAPSSPGMTLEATFALAAFGLNPATVKKNGHSPADFLATQAAAFSATPGGAAKLVVGLATMDLDPAAFGGVNPLALMDANYTTATGAYGADVFAQSLFMLADAALGRSVPTEAITYLNSLQKADGGWEFCCAYGEDTNATALAIRALIAAGVAASDTHIVNGVAYLKASQQPDGGIPYSAPGSSDPNSTAYAIQAIVAVGGSLDAGGAWDAGAGATPLVALKASQNATTGELQYFGTDSAFATYQGVAGLMLSAFPEQAEYSTEGTISTSTATRTSTNTPTATATPATPTATFTSTSTAHVKTRTATSVPATATPVAAATSTAPAGGVVNGSSAAAPTRLAAVAGEFRLPSAGAGPDGDAGTPASAIVLLLMGGGLLGAGTVSMRRWRGTV